MAPRKTAAATPATSAATPADNSTALNVTVLHRVAAAVAAGNPGYDFVTQDEGASLVGAGLIDINPEITNGNGGVAAILTEAGAKLVAEQSADDNTAKAAAAKFEIDSDVPLAPKKGGGGGGQTRESIYPFDALQVGQSFHLPVTSAMPKPNRTIASAVSLAMAKHAVEVLDEAGQKVMEPFERKNKAGEVIERGSRPKTQNTRVFTIRAVDASDPRGAGARVYRTA